VNTLLSYTKDGGSVVVFKVKGKCTGYFETSHPVEKYMLKYLKNIVMISPGQCKDYQSHIFSYKPHN